MQIIKNNILAVTIAEFGAELQSIRRLDDNREYLWQGDAQYWGRRAPILFPMVGKVWNNEFRMDGRAWPMGQHGFARDREFSVTGLTDTSVTFTLEADAETLRMFPRAFRLAVTYTLSGKTLAVTWTVTNTGRFALPFQIGAHPAFQYPDWHVDDPVHGYLSFNVKDKLLSTVLVPSGYRSVTQAPFEVALDADGRLALTNDTFQSDTIIDARHVLDNVSLHDKQGRRLLTVRFDMPLLALWSPQKGRAPFVCIEPWCGCCDIEGYTGLYADRDIINGLLPGETFRNEYAIDF